METYTVLRAFADSWFLLAMFAFFLGTLVFAFWPALTPDREDAAAIPLRDETAKCPAACTGCTRQFQIEEDQKNG